jgi:hypothetical protein
MISYQPVELDLEAERMVANWLALKGLVAEQVGKVEKPIPESHYRQVHRFRGAPPNTMRVWIGCRWNLASPDRPSSARLFDFHFMPVTDAFPKLPLPPELEDYRRAGGVFNGFIFQVGHFFGLALQHDLPGLQVRPNPSTEAVDALLPIWPTGPTIQWPPARPVDDLGDPHKVTRFLQIASPPVRVSEP